MFFEWPLKCFELTITFHSFFLVWSLCPFASVCACQDFCFSFFLCCSSTVSFNLWSDFISPYTFRNKNSKPLSDNHRHMPLCIYRVFSSSSSVRLKKNCRVCLAIELNLFLWSLLASFCSEQIALFADEYLVFDEPGTVLRCTWLQSILQNRFLVFTS